jgi:hypothetical protein
MRSIRAKASHPLATAVKRAEYPRGIEYRMYYCRQINIDLSNSNFL